VADCSRDIFSINYPTILAGAILTLYLPQKLCNKISSSCNNKSTGPSGYPFYYILVEHQYANYMTKGGKDAIKKTGDHN
jgi:hypothetical protein